MWNKKPHTFLKITDSYKLEMGQTLIALFLGKYSKNTQNFKFMLSIFIRFLPEAK